MKHIKEFPLNEEMDSIRPTPTINDIVKGDRLIDTLVIYLDNIPTRKKSYRTICGEIICYIEDPEMKCMYDPDWRDLHDSDPDKYPDDEYKQMGSDKDIIVDAINNIEDEIHDGAFEEMEYADLDSDFENFSTIYLGDNENDWIFDSPWRFMLRIYKKSPKSLKSFKCTPTEWALGIYEAIKKESDSLRILSNLKKDEPKLWNLIKGKSKDGIVSDATILGDYGF